MDRCISREKWNRGHFNAPVCSLGMGGETRTKPRVLAGKLVIGDANDGLANKWLKLRSRRAEVSIRM